MTEPLLPWQHDQWRSVTERLRAGNLPHALLLAGPAGLGKNRFAARLIQTVLCEQGAANGEPCGRCRSCTLFAANSHPDLRVVAPADAGKAIVVDQIREAGAYLTQTTQYGGYKALIIRPADQMNINAANCLLKTLEEPGARTLILLVSGRPVRLPATIVSRCQRLAFTPPAADTGRQWLQERIAPEHDAALLLALAEGAPLRALALVEDETLAVRGEVMEALSALAQRREGAITVADRLVKLGIQPALYWMYSGTADLLRLLAGGGEASVVNRDLAPQLRELAQAAAPQEAHRFLGELQRGLSLSERPLNSQLLMEGLLMSWQALFQPHTHRLR